MKSQNVIIYAWENILLIYRRNIFARPHRHHAIQITLAITEQFEVIVADQVSLSQGIIIGQDVQHQVSGQAAWVATLFVNPETPLAATIRSEVLQNASHHLLLETAVSPIRPLLQKAQQHTLTCDQAQHVLQQILSHLLGHVVHPFQVDPRVQNALDLIQQQTEKKIPAHTLSAAVFLSEGRFRHLFKAEIGVPLRRYLLWQRLTMGMYNICHGQNFTEAAHEAGFTDLAHFSRTCRLMLGITLSDMFADPTSIQVMRCAAQ